MNRIDLTQAEWQLMEKLWDHAPQTGRELTEAMAANASPRKPMVPMAARVQ